MNDSYRGTGSAGPSLGRTIADMNDNCELPTFDDNQQSAKRRSWRRSMLLGLGGLSGVGVALAIGASAATASPHVASAPGTTSTGVTLCAKSSGAVVYSKTGACASGKKLTLATSAQVKSLTTKETALASTVAALTPKVSTLQTQHTADAADISTLQSQHTADAADIATLQSQHSTDASAISALQGDVATLQTNEASDSSGVNAANNLLTGITRGNDSNGNKTLTISGENVQIVNGTGDETNTNGLGNLIVGYNTGAGNETGSHNLVVGEQQTYSSYGGILGGLDNTTTAADESVTGGEANVASGPNDAIVGGCNNVTGTIAIPAYSCNQFNDDVVLGGVINTARGDLATVGGGQSNIASGGISSVAGGLGNLASGEGATDAGGYGNKSTNNESAVSGGGSNVASGEVSAIAGGYLNKATDDESTVAGGCSNLAGDGTSSLASDCTNFGNSFQSITGGMGNHAVNLGSVADGGVSNSINSASGGVGDTLAGGHSESITSTGQYYTKLSSGSLIQP